MILVKKLKFFHLLCLSKIDGEKLFADVLDKKEAFKDYKNDCLQRNEKLEFLQRVHRFGLKLEISWTLVFMQKRPRKTIWERSS